MKCMGRGQVQARSKGRVMRCDYRFRLLPITNSFASRMEVCPYRPNHAREIERETGRRPSLLLKQMGRL